MSVMWVKYFYLGKLDVWFSDLSISLVIINSKIIINLYSITNFCILDKQEVKHKNKNNSNITSNYNHFTKKDILATTTTTKKCRKLRIAKSLIEINLAL